MWDHLYVPCNASVWQPSFEGLLWGRRSGAWQMSYFLHLLHRCIKNQSRTMSPSGRGFGDFPYLWSGGRRFDSQEGPIAKGSGMVLGYLFTASQHKLIALVQGWLQDSSTQWMSFPSKPTTPSSKLLEFSAFSTNITFGQTKFIYILYWVCKTLIYKGSI